MREESEAVHAVEKYSDLIRRICFLHLKNRNDTEDIAQSVFLKYILYQGTFESDEHEKAWFIRVTVNTCKDWLKSLLRHPAVPLDVLSEEALAVSDDHHELLQTVLSLPSKYKDVIFLFYYEGYTAGEIANILGKKENTIYSLMSRGRALLKERLGGDGLE
ncbi:RNA polymerase sigma factor [Anaerolentibacter hominis]|uniref:RNA polymerase sigma factor n=1 Tax=Anaerolentibacter hominis TaxID=3079009 RepID=UPI0031B88FA7